ncbi:MAG TPA: FAD-dependent oxidoreductase [Candidatus Acidoferrales bacterium]|nr:FAD-dependent oxidoreductase [Candidatus Acidoferrales bacterium]
MVILGAGPAGVGAAYQLARRGIAHPIVLEQRETVGGNAGSFEVDGIWADYGSHRLHPSCDPEILADLQDMLGGNLVSRPRHGRIRLRGRWIHFPLKPVDLILHLPPPFALGVASDMIRRFFRGSCSQPETFSSVLERALGSTICTDFYFPYARKIWGIPPEAISVAQARRRVSANSLSKMFRKVASSIPGLKPPGAGRFYYPRLGYGEISERLYKAAATAGAEFRFGSRVTAIEREDNRITAVRFTHNNEEVSISVDTIWSTLPITVLARCIQPQAPAAILEAASKISFRGMILIYLVLEQKRFTEYDAHYFPEASIPISRLSEPKNYSLASEPANRTLLCAELPTDRGSPEWEMSDEQLGELLCGWLAQAGLPVSAPVRRAFTRRLPQAYPIYPVGYEAHFDAIDNWLQQIKGLLTFGRQGLFAHDNTHHALYMAYAAAECFNHEGVFDWSQWHEFREVFETHVVED